MMTLQNLCLEVIAENFESYYTAFSTSKDPSFKRKMEFLQRVYSFEIAEQVYEDCGMEEKYIDILINKYLKILDTNWFSDSTWKTVVAKIADIGPNIKKILVDECCSEDRPWPEIFCYLPNLEVVHFRDDCIDDILKSIAKFCPNVIEIDIRSSDDVTDLGLLSLCEIKNGKVPCPNLKKLLLKSCKVKETVAKCLIKNISSLEVFDYYKLPLVLYSIHKEDLPELDKIPPYHFIILDFNYASRFSYFTDILKVCSSVCPFVTSVSCRLRKPQHLELLSGFSHLETLDLKCGYKECLNINHLLKSRGSKLTSLTIHNCSLSVLTLAESCPALKLLSMNSVSFEEQDGSIPLFHNLDSFIVERTELSNCSNNLKSLCLILSSSPRLEAITLKQCNLSASKVKTELLKCFEHCCVKKIDFNNSSVDKRLVMDILLTCHSLVHFNLEDCGLDSYEHEIYRCAKILPNNPQIDFTGRYSSSDFDDSFNYFFDDFFHHIDLVDRYLYLDDGENYYFEYEDYLSDYEDDDDDDIYGYFP